MKSPYSNKWLLFFLLPFIHFTSLCSQSLTDSLDSALTQLNQEVSLPGFAVAIVNKDEVLYQKGYGYADLEKKTPYDIHTIHNIGSVSKTFIAVAIMKLVEEGRLSLDDEINQYLPFEIIHPKHPDVPITVRHLATHTSGIIDSKYYFKACYVLQETFSKEQMARLPKANQRDFKKIKDNVNGPLGDFIKDYLKPKEQFYSKRNFNKHAPGTHYKYSNIGSAVAAYVVEMVSGQDYGTFVKENILDPLQMKSSAWHFKDLDMEKFATCYAQNRAPFPKYRLLTYPDGGLMATCHDLALYLSAMMKGYYKESDLLNADSFQEMMKLQFEGEEKTGIFWSITKIDNIGHNGADPGIFTYILFRPTENMGVVFMTNTDVFEDKTAINEFIAIWKTCGKYGSKMMAK